MTLIITLVFAGCGASSSSSSPKKEVKWPSSVQLVVAATAGGFADAHARIITQYLQKATGVPFAVVNQADGGGIVAYDTVKNAKPDGSVLLFYHSNFIIACETGVYDADPVADFTTVAWMEPGGIQVVVVSAKSPYKTLDDYVNAALAKPGQVSFGMQTGGASHFIGALLGKDKGVEFNFIEAGNQTEKIVSVLGGYLDACNISPNAAKQYELSGDMRVLCSTSAYDDPFYPEYKTAVSQGYPSAAFDADYWLIGPKGMDPALVELINGALKGLETDPEIKDALAKQGSVYTWRSPEDSLARMTQQAEALRDVAKSLGLAD
jgi:tripartite-type tricarboxylate transporter receptor subunit TctC